jgi:hypothetical protein
MRRPSRKRRARAMARRAHDARVVGAGRSRRSHPRTNPRRRVVVVENSL